MCYVTNFQIYWKGTSIKVVLLNIYPATIKLVWNT